MMRQATAYLCTVSVVCLHVLLVFYEADGHTDISLKMRGFSKDVLQSLAHTAAKSAVVAVFGITA